MGDVLVKCAVTLTARLPVLMMPARIVMSKVRCERSTGVKATSWYPIGEMLNSGAAQASVANSTLAAADKVWMDQSSSVGYTPLLTSGPAARLEW